MRNNRISHLENSKVMWQIPAAEMKLTGTLAEAVGFIERNQICEVGLWQKFVEQYRTMPDGKDKLWRCEYWGKMMRGASMILRYTGADGLYRILEDSVRDMLTAEDEHGRFSTYTADKELSGWDMWGRKYVLLGMQYFLEICRDEALAEKVIAAMCRHADYILQKVGKGEGKIEIYHTATIWGGMASCSVLEPFVRLYRLTGERRYFDFATYVVESGFTSVGSLIELALENKLALHEYPVVKAYEMMSCFEGLIQYYYLTGIEKYKQAALQFGERILSGELSIIGCSGCTHELFDHTALMQTKLGYDGVMQETCVGVTWLKLATALLELSGDSRYADAIETTFYNNYMGALNTERRLTVNRPEKHLPQVMPFDSYSPLTPDRRGKFIGGYCAFPDGTFYGCCACIGGAGAGIIPQMTLLHRKDGVVMSYYEQGRIRTVTPGGGALQLDVSTDYPKNGEISVTLYPDTAKTFSFFFRVPAWCEDPAIRVNGEAVEVTAGYTAITRTWCAGDVVELSFPMEITRVLPPEGAENEALFAAYRHGPTVLAADRRVTEPTEVIDVVCNENGVAEGEAVFCPEVPVAKKCFAVKTESRGTVRLIDYASAGKTWGEDSLCAAWLYRKK